MVTLPTSIPIVHISTIVATRIGTSLAVVSTVACSYARLRNTSPDTCDNEDQKKNTTRQATQTNGTNTIANEAAGTQRKTIRSNKPTMNKIPSQCIHQTLKNKASTRTHSGVRHQSVALIQNHFL